MFEVFRPLFAAKMDTDIQKLFGANVKKYRLVKKITQQALGDLCDIEYQNISRIEQGKTNPTLRNIVKLANALGIEVQYLFEGIIESDNLKKK